DVRTPGFLASLLSAIVVELPLALLAIFMARRLLRLPIGQVMRDEGLTGQVPPLWRVPLLGPAPGTALRRLIKAGPARSALAAAAGHPPGAQPSRIQPSVRRQRPSAGREDHPPAA